jgi:hypothetical protein
LRSAKKANKVTHFEVSLERKDRCIDGLVGKLGKFVQAIEKGPDVCGQSFEVIRENLWIQILGDCGPWNVEMGLAAPLSPFTLTPTSREGVKGRD